MNTDTDTDTDTNTSKITYAFKIKKNPKLRTEDNPENKMYDPFSKSLPFDNIINVKEEYNTKIVKVIELYENKLMDHLNKVEIK